MTSPIDTDTASARSKACVDCRRPGLLVEELGGVYCPVCHARMARYGVARAHLANLLAPVLGAWQDHWAAQGLTLGDAAAIAGRFDVETLLEA